MRHADGEPTDSVWEEGYVTPIVEGKKDRSLTRISTRETNVERDSPSRLSKGEGQKPGQHRRDNSTGDLPARVVSGSGGLPVREDGAGRGRACT